MPAPWEKYAKATDAAPEGPWTKYAAASPKAAEPGMFEGVAKSAIDSLPMIGGVAGGILGTPADALVGPMGNVAGAAIGGYLGTASKNLINRYYDPQSAPKTAAESITQPIVGGIEQGLMQGTGEALAPVIGKVAQAAAGATKWAGSKLLSSLGGVNTANIKQYAQFADRINSAPSVEALKDVSDNFVGKLAADVETKKLTSNQAHEAFKGFQSDLKDAYRTQGYDARDAVNSAQQSLKDAHGARIQQLSGDIYDTVNRLKSDLQSGSGAALKTLDNATAKVDLAPTYSKIDSTIERLKQGGTDESLAVAGKLQEYKERLLSKNWAEIAPQDAKRLIQGLDQVTEYSPMAGNFDKTKNAAFKEVRASLDSTLKDTIPEYRNAMAPVARDADLLNRVSHFGDKQTAAGLLGRINAPNQLESRAALQELGKKYGADFVKAAHPESLPEQALLRRTQAAQDALRPDRVAAKIDQTLGSSRQKAAMDSAQSELSAAQDKLTPFKPIAPNVAGQTTVQQKLAQLGKGGNIELEDMFGRLGKLTDTDFIQAMKDNNVKAAFQKGATNGSRNTLMGSVVGWTLGGAAGVVPGAAVGRAVDQWGPAITKKILDGAIRVSKTPTVATIRALELPEPIKRNMVIGLEQYLARDSGRAGVGVSSLRNVAEQDNNKASRSPTGESKWAQDGASRIGLSASDSEALMQSPKARKLLIQASDLKPGSKAMQNIQIQIRDLLKGAK
jgi:hypothetical protein